MGESPLNANPSDSRNKSASSSNKHDAQYVNITDLMHPYHPRWPNWKLERTGIKPKLETLSNQISQQCIVSQTQKISDPKETNQWWRLAHLF